MKFQAYTLQSHNEWACIQVKTPNSETRTPVHLCCVIDTSSSMNIHNKLENIKQSLHFLLDFLTPQDSISLITFSETARTILSQAFITSNEKDTIRARISIVHAETNTNLSAGIIQARDSLQINTENIKQGILLLTDGVANKGLVRSNDIIKLVQNTIQKFNGTSISCIGYGTDHNVDLLQNISSEGGGSYYVVNNLEDVATVFGDILGGLLSCLSQQVRVILPTGTEVKSRYATHLNNDHMEIIIGDMPAGSEAAFLAKIPVGQPVLVKGYDLQTHNTFELNTTVSATEDATLQMNGEAHYLRFEVLELIEETRSLVRLYPPNTIINTHIEKINACISTIMNYQSDHTLWRILLEELNTCKQSLENRHLNTMNTPQIMSQHISYLGRMRGVPATLSQMPNIHSMTGVDESSDPIAAPLLERTFSNYTQRQIITGLASTITSPPIPSAVFAFQNHTANNYLSSGDTTPVNHLSPILRGMTTAGAHMDPISIDDTLPYPSWPLRRQTACGSTIISRSTSANESE